MSLSSKTLVTPFAVGLALGLLFQRMGFEPAVKIVGEVQVIGTLWTNAMLMTVVPLVLVGIVCTFAGDYGRLLLGRIGIKTLLTFLAVLTGAALVTMLIAPVFLSTIPVQGWSGPSSLERATGVGTATMQAPPISAWVTSFIPVNPVKALADGYLPAVIFFAVALGSAISWSSVESRSELRAFFESISAALNKVTEFVLRAAPIGVFVLALSFGVRLGAGAAGATAVYVVLVVLSCVAVGLLMYPLAASLGGVGILAFARACIRPQLIAAAARSSRAALPAQMKDAEENLAIKPQISRTVLPFGETLFSPGVVIAQTAGLLVLAHLYDRDLTILTILYFAFVAVLASARTPDVLSHSMTVMAPIYVMSGIPAEGLGLLLVIDAIPQSFRSAVNVTANMAVAAIVSRRTDLSADELAVAPSTI